MGEPAAKTPKSPPGLGLRGRRLWRESWATYTFNVAEEALLEQACHVADTIDVLVAAVKDQPATVTGSRGQVRPNPLHREIREERALLKNLLGSLGLPNDDPDSWEGLSTSERGRRAAMARWRKGT